MCSLLYIYVIDNKSNNKYVCMCIHINIYYGLVAAALT